MSEPDDASTELSAPPSAPPTSTPPVLDAKAAEAVAIAAFQAWLREITPRVAVVPALVALNLAVFVAMIASGVSPMSPKVADLIKWGANFGPRTLGGQPWRILTGAFLHSGVLHIAMNMFALWSSGLLIERMFGRTRLATIYLFAAVTGGIASVALHPRITSVGASGAVFGLFGALGAFLVRERGSVPPVVLARLGRVAGTFVVYNIVFGFTQPLVDNAAHIGGLLGGALAGAWLARPLVPARARSWRPAAVLALSALAVVVAPRLLPPSPDLMATMERFGVAETQSIAKYNELLGRRRDGTLSPADFAAGIEHDVLPGLRTARADLGVPRRWAPEERAVIERVTRYDDAREHAWELVARALRTNAPDDVAAANTAAGALKRLSDALEQDQTQNEPTAEPTKKR